MRGLAHRVIDQVADVFRRMGLENCERKRGLSLLKGLVLMAAKLVKMGDEQERLLDFAQGSALPEA